MTEVEYVLVNDEDMPPVVITMGREDNPKIVLNAHYKIWLALHRKTIGGSAEALFGKIDGLLTGMLQEQRNDELMQ